MIRPTMTSILRFAAAAFTALVVAGALAPAAGARTPFWLRPLPHPLDATSSVQSINRDGHLAGAALFADGSHAYLWRGRGGPLDLGLLGPGAPAQSSATDVNRWDTVVGASSTDTGATHAFRWRHGVMSDLGTLGGDMSVAEAINDRGVIAGRASRADGEERAVIWRNGRIRALRGLGGYSTAWDINDRGLIIGAAGRGGPGETDAVVWRRGRLIDLGTVGGVSAALMAVNRWGTAVGVWTDADGNDHAFLWRRGRITALRGVTLATAVNDRGVVVGARLLDTSFGPYRAVIWRKGTSHLLSGLVTPRWTVDFAHDINNGGQIAADAVAPRTQFEHAVRLTPRRR